jgi:hypothetical protein
LAPLKEVGDFARGGGCAVGEGVLLLLLLLLLFVNQLLPPCGLRKLLAQTHDFCVAQRQLL